MIFPFFRSPLAAGRIVAAAGVLCAAAGLPAPGAGLGGVVRTPVTGSLPPAGEQLSRTRALPVGTQLVLRDLRLRLIGVNANRPEDENDDEAVVSVRTAVESRELTIRELTIGYIGDYEIHVLNAVPFETKPGRGTARITVRYQPRS